jgi:hypothetical protein
MDEQTFRRLAPDAVAGRLDAASYERWKAATAEDPARATFVVRVAEADAKISGLYGPAIVRTISPPSRRVPRRTFVALAVVFALLGLTAGGLVMHSYLKTRGLKPKGSANDLIADSAGSNAPKSGDNRPVNQPAASFPANNQPEPEPEPEPDPEPEPPLDTGGLRLVSAADAVSVRGERDAEWRKLVAGEAVPDGAIVSKQGAARFRSGSVEIYSAGAMQFELVDGAIRFIEGRASVRVSLQQAFSCYKQTWSMTQGGFVVEPRRLGGEVYLIEGTATLGAVEVASPSQVAVDGTRHATPLTSQQIVQLELELLGPHRVLLHWDCESDATSPELGEIAKPGALGDGRAFRRKSGQPGIGVAASTDVFKAEPNGRLRMRVKTDAARLRIEFRVKLDTGFRVVDAQIDLRGNDSWQTLDVSLDILRAGRFRDEPGWLPGRAYSAFLLAPAVNPDNPLARHDLLVDDLIVYVLE